MRKRRLGMQSTSTSHLFFIWPASKQMRLSRVTSALVPVLSFIARADASANATMSPTLSGTSLSTQDRSGTVMSNPPYAEDQERIGGIKELGWGGIAASLQTKYRNTLREQKFNSLPNLEGAWWSADRTNPHLVYAKLKIDTLDETILSNFWFHAWVKYVHDYNLAHPENKVSIMRKLHEQYGDRKLSMMLEEAKRNKSPLLRAIGLKLQIELMSYWKGKNVSPGQLYRMLQSDEQNVRLLIDREYHIWNIYFSKFMPGESMDHFDQLYHTFGEKELILLLIKSTRSMKTEPYAKVFEKKLADEWLEKAMTPKFVFEQLMLDSSPYGLLDYPEVYVWLHYAEMYRRKKTTDVTLNEMLKTYYSDDGIKEIIESSATAHGKAYAKVLADERTQKLPLSAI